MKIEELWKPIEGYETLYEVSNLGRIKSLPRKTKNQFGRTERILKTNLNPDGYPTLSLSKGNRRKTYSLHLLVWDAFGHAKRNGLILQVDHKDDNKENACITNLHLLNNRQNSTKAKLSNKKNDLPTGVSYDKKWKKFRAEITYNGKKKLLGAYTTALQASNAYQQELGGICLGK